MQPEVWKRVSALFESAIEIAPDRRDAWLRDASGGDHEIEAAVLKLLRADNDAASQDFLEISNPASDPDLLDAAARRRHR